MDASSRTGDSRTGDELLRRLRAVAAGRNRLGVCFRDEEVQDVVALILLSYPAEERAAPPPPAVAALLGAFAVRAGARPGDDGGALAARVGAYLQASPPNPFLVELIAEVLKDMVATGALERGSAFAKFAAEDGARGVLGGGVRPAGTVAAGPLAAFLARADGDTKKKQS